MDGAVREEMHQSNYLVKEPKCGGFCEKVIPSIQFCFAVCVKHETQTDLLTSKIETQQERVRISDKRTTMFTELQKIIENGNSLKMHQEPKTQH